VAYATLEEILADRELGLGKVQPTIEAVRRAIDNRLRSMRRDTVNGISDDYMRLAVARVAISKIDGNNSVSHELGTIPPAIRERALAIIEGQGRASSIHPSAEEVMCARRSFWVTKASDDFRSYRVFPLTGIMALLAVVLAGKKVFDISQPVLASTAHAAAKTALDKTTDDTPFLMVLVILVAFIVLFIARIVQSWDEETLLRLFDPDIQGNALRKVVGLSRSFTRTEFRDSLAFAADEQLPRQWAFILPHLLNSKLIRRVANSAHGDLDWGASVSDFSAEAQDNEIPALRQFLRTGGILTTVKFTTALEEAAELSIMRFAEMDLLHSVQELGVTRYTVKRLSPAGPGPDHRRGGAARPAGRTPSAAGRAGPGVPGLLHPVAAGRFINPTTGAAWDAWQAERYQRAEISQRPGYTESPFRPR